MTAIAELTTHYRAVRNRLDSVAKLPWHAPQVVEVEQPTTLRGLIRYVATLYDLDPKELVESDGIGKRRIVEARRDLYYRAYQTNRFSTAQIGNALKRDHSTIVLVVKRYAKRHNLPVLCKENRHSYLARKHAA
jgi:chromosomal replication initiation ATPase DnaA